jgi:hypothetical protein
VAAENTVKHNDEILLHDTPRAAQKSVVAQVNEFATALQNYITSRKSDHEHPVTIRNRVVQYIHYPGFLPLWGMDLEG